MSIIEIPFKFVPKLQPKHIFMNMIRTMNPMTTQYRCLLGILNGIQGDLAGEFIIDERIPDGRCVFRSKDRNIVILCYFRKGVLQTGPRLTFDKIVGKILIRSAT